MLLTPEEAHALTLPSHEAMQDAHHDSMGLWNRLLLDFPKIATALQSAEKYAFLHRLIGQHLAANVAANARYIDALGFASLLIEDRALVRFKHLDGSFKPRAYPTNQQQHLGRQEFTEEMMEQLAIEGVLAPPTVLTLGYNESNRGDAIDRIVIVCRTPSLQYFYDVKPGAAGFGPTVVQPFPGILPPAPRVISKRQEEEQGAQDAD